MTDIREAVLVRLRDIAEDIEDVLFAVRNTLDIGENRMPAIAVLEGDEEPSSSVEGRNRQPTAPIPMIMVPEVCILAIGASDKIGPMLSELRSALIKAVTTDEELAAILGRNGVVAYRGMVSDLGLGRAMLGRMSLRFAITYILFPDRL